MMRLKVAYGLTPSYLDDKPLRPGVPALLVRGAASKLSFPLDWVFQPWQLLPGKPASRGPRALQALGS